MTLRSDDQFTYTTDILLSRKCASREELRSWEGDNRRGDSGGLGGRLGQFL